MKNKKPIDKDEAYRVEFYRSLFLHEAAFVLALIVTLAVLVYAFCFQS